MADAQEYFWEVIYETGNFSVTFGTEEEVLEGIREHHSRAVKGLRGSAADSRPRADVTEVPIRDWVAERVKRVLRYDRHPGEWNPDETMSSEVIEQELKSAVKALAHEGTVSVPEVASALRMMTDPLVVSGPHESNFKMKELGELSPAAWGAEPAAPSGGDS